MENKIHEQVRHYYSEVLSHSRDLQTNVCCCCQAGLPPYQREILSLIAPEITNRFYGCGSPIPPDIEGCTVLDLGCGTGRDVYLASKLVGPTGRVIGIDMTESQLEVAREHRDEQMRKFGFTRPNVEFHLGRIEDLSTLGIEENSLDLIISNCVINLAPDKEKVFASALRSLKPGGEMYFSDVFCDRRLPDEVRNDPVLYSECLGGALYIEDFRRLLDGMGFPDCRIVAASRVTISSDSIPEKIGEARFHSLTIRIFNIEGLEDGQEDYGQTARYQGTIPESPDRFVLDQARAFPADRAVPVSRNEASMLTRSRYARHFIVSDEESAHRGIFVAGDRDSECCSGA